MLSPDNKYTIMQRTQYNRETQAMAKEDHKGHNDNPDYWEMFIEEAWLCCRGSGTLALDFGCGTGRNVANLIRDCTFDKVWGADISEQNIKYCKSTMPTRVKDNTKFGFEEVSGVDLEPFENNMFQFIMSTIVLQHICVHDIRFQILEDMYRVMDFGGLLSIQMGFGPSHPRSRDYYDNFFDAKHTNSGCDTRVEHPNQLAGELAIIGFKNIQVDIRKAWNDSHDNWIYIRARKL